MARHAPLRRIADLLRHAAAALDPPAAPAEVAQVDPLAETMAALAARFPGAPEHWLRHIATAAPWLATEAMTEISHAAPEPAPDRAPVSPNAAADDAPEDRALRVDDRPTPLDPAPPRSSLRSHLRPSSPAAAPRDDGRDAVTAAPASGPAARPRLRFVAPPTASEPAAARVSHRMPVGGTTAASRLSVPPTRRLPPRSAVPARDPPPPRVIETLLSPPPPSRPLPPTLRYIEGSTRPVTEPLRWPALPAALRMPSLELQPSHDGEAVTLAIADCRRQATARSPIPDVAEGVWLALPISEAMAVAVASPTSADALRRAQERDAWSA